MPLGNRKPNFGKPTSGRLTKELKFNPTRKRRRLIVLVNNPARLRKGQPTANGAFIERMRLQNLAILRVRCIENRALADEAAAPADHEDAGTRRARFFQAGFQLLNLVLQEQVDPQIPRISS